MSFCKRSVAHFVILSIGLAIAAGGRTGEPVSPPPRPAPSRVAEDLDGRKASVRTDNFVVEAPNERIARVVGETAERERKARALLWLGKELPAWSERCTLRVTVTSHGSGGFTTFNFDDGKVLSRTMGVSGTLEDILTCVLPHEITHTILADHFREPLPRWADEGAAVLSEDKAMREKYHADLTGLLRAGRALPLRRLVAVTDYPDDPMALYTEGFTLTEFLVERKDRKTFLQFLKQGKRDGWEKAVKENYGYADLEKLEDAWLAAMKK